jgi:carbonic anhydrase
MEKIRKLLLENKAWAQSKVDIDEKYFSNMAMDQNPEYLWIGCSDSRVPESEITNSTPGDIFVHRNIANLVIHTDINFLSVLTFAVNHLKVPHIIVCGHYNCGGVKAALSFGDFGLINNWVRNIKDTYFSNKVEIEKIPDEKGRVNKLVELNIVAQVQNLARTSIVQEAWHNNQALHIHGWVYDLNTGKLNELISLHPDTEIDSAYKYEF